jgi:hypothetical protein
MIDSEPHEAVGAADRSDVRVSRSGGPRRWSSASTGPTWGRSGRWPSPRGGDDRPSMRDPGIDRRAATRHLARLVQRCRSGAYWHDVSADRRTGYVCFGLGLGLFFVCQGLGRGFTAMIANAVRLLVSAGAGLAAVYWLGLGATGLFVAIAFGFCIYAALTVLAVVRISPPAMPSAQ